MQPLKVLFVLGALLPFALADGAAIVAAMQTIEEDSTALNSTVASFDGNILTVLKILLQSTELLGGINDGTKTAQESANLTTTEALQLATATQSLSSTVNSTLTTIISKKPVFDKELLSPAILLNLKIEKAASDKFSAAVLEKVPAALQSIAETLIAPIDDAFDNAIAEYALF